MALQSLSALAYRRVASPLHAAQPAVAALWACAVLIAILLAQQPLSLVAIFAALLLCARLVHAGRSLLPALKLVAGLAVPIIVVNVLVSRQGLTVFARLGDLGPFGQGDLTVEALVYGAVTALRVADVLLLGALASLSIDPDLLLAQARRISFRSALTAALAVRMVPLLAADAARLSEAQRTRPQPLGRLRGRALVASAILSGALDRALDVAATLELRGLAAPRNSLATGRAGVLNALSSRRASHTSRPSGRPLRSALRAASRHDLSLAGSALLLLCLAVGGSMQSFERFSAYPRIAADFNIGTVVLAAALAVVPVLPLLARKGIDR